MLIVFLSFYIIRCFGIQSTLGYFAVPSWGTAWSCCSQLAKQLGTQITKKEHRIYLCNGSLQCFTTGSRLQKHKSECRKLVTTMSEGKNIILKFTKHNRNKYNPHFNLPKQRLKKNACINIQNNDEYCFKLAIISAFTNDPTNADRPAHYKIPNIACETIEYEDEMLCFKNMQFPLGVKDTRIFEANNPTISVNVFGYEINDRAECKIIGPYYHTREEKAKHINLLYCESRDDDKTHYVYIKNISRLLGSQIAKKEHRMHLCNGCLLRFATESGLQKHKNECRNLITIMPEEKNKLLKFINHNRKLKVPFVVYADFESILRPVTHCAQDPETSSTTDVQQHIPCAFSYFIKCSFDDNLNKHPTFVGENSPTGFVKMLAKDLTHLRTEIIGRPKPMIPLTQRQKHHQNTSPICSICKGFFF